LLPAEPPGVAMGGADMSAPYLRIGALRREPGERLVSRRK
jgi:hypothetical protein